MVMTTAPGVLQLMVAMDSEREKLRLTVEIWKACVQFACWLVTVACCCTSLLIVVIAVPILVLTAALVVIASRAGFCSRNYSFVLVG